MLRNTFTLSLVATMLAGMSMVATLEPAKAHGCDGDRNWQSNSFSNGRFNNGVRFNRFDDRFGNRFNDNNFRLDNQALKRQIKQERKLARQIQRQEMAAAGIPFGNNAIAPAYTNVVNNPYAYLGNTLPVSNVNNNVAFNAGYNAGFNDAANGIVGNGFVSGLGTNNLNGLGLNGLGLNGLNLGTGGGISSILGQVLNRF